MPVTADLEAGFGDDPEDVAETIRLAVAAGGNIEDVGANPNALIDEGLAVERVTAARAAEELRRDGTFSYAQGQIPQGELNALFAANLSGGTPEPR